MKRLLTGLLLITLVLGACARSAPAPPPKASPPATIQPAAKAPAAQSKPSPLAQIIEGAKKEGQLLLTLSPEHTPAPMVERMRSDIREKYGVDLNLKVMAYTNQSGQVATAIMEQNSGTVATYDVMTLGSDLVPVGQKAGVWEMVDWKSLFVAGTPPEVIPNSHELAAGLVIWSGMVGITYNPTKVSKSEVPKTLAELGDPKWKGRLGIQSYASYYTRWGFLLGKDKILSALRSIMKNKPLVDLMPPLNNRYLLGEIDLQLNTSAYVDTNRKRGMPSEWQSLEFIESRDFEMVVRKGAAHPNAAKLFAIYMVSPDGFKFNIQQVGVGSRHYPGNIVYDATIEAQKKGALYTMDNRPELLNFVLSADYDKFEKEFELALKGQG